MQGTIAVTDPDWYEHLRLVPDLEEANFWKPTATRALRAEPFSPFLFKLRGERLIVGFGLFARYSRLPIWLAWETFREANGCASIDEMRRRIEMIRDRMRFSGPAHTAEIGCILIVQPIFFPPDSCVACPKDWPIHLQGDKKYDLGQGEGLRVWHDCLMAAKAAQSRFGGPKAQIVETPEELRFGTPTLVRPRLGQGTFRIAVTEAYGRSCAVTGEHSLPALEAAHIRPYRVQGPHETGNGILLRADFHRLFDQGYLTIGADCRLEVSQRLRADFENGRSYYPFHGQRLRYPDHRDDLPRQEYIDWHRENVYLG
jgi:putative restriction endonuclease